MAIKLKLIILTLIGICVLPQFAAAHGFGMTIERVNGEYLLDVDYNTYELQKNEPVRFTIRLLNTVSREEMIFTDVSFKVLRNDEVIQDLVLKTNEWGPFAVTQIAFPKGGDYELIFNFRNDNNQLVEITAPVTVIDPSSGGILKTIGRIALLLSLPLITLGYLFWPKLKFWRKNK